MNAAKKFGIPGYGDQCEELRAQDPLYCEQKSGGYPVKSTRNSSEDSH